MQSNYSFAFASVSTASSPYHRVSLIQKFYMKNLERFSDNYVLMTSFLRTNF